MTSKFLTDLARDGDTTRTPFAHRLRLAALEGDLAQTAEALAAAIDGDRPADTIRALEALGRLGEQARQLATLTRKHLEA